MHADVHLATLICALDSVELFCVANCFINCSFYMTSNNYSIIPRFRFVAKLRSENPATKQAIPTQRTTASIPNIIG